jgi:hypothetical protein
VELREKICVTSFEMIQQKDAFLITRESVRLVFRAKPSMNAIVVQLLVDLRCAQSVRNRIARGKRRKFFCGSNARDH